MILTDKFYRDCENYRPEDNSENWKEFEELNKIWIDIDNRSSNKNEHTITFHCFVPTSGNRRKYCKVVFSRYNRTLIEVKQDMGYGKQLKTDDVDQLLKAYTNFINEMAFNGYLLV